MAKTISNDTRKKFIGRISLTCCNQNNCFLKLPKKTNASIPQLTLTSQIKSRKKY